jgi:hypothetical protein
MAPTNARGGGERFAARIVEFAEGHLIDPVTPSRLPDIGRAESDFSPGAPLASLDIEIGAYGRDGT